MKFLFPAAGRGRDRAASEPRLVSASRTGTGRDRIDNILTSLSFAVIGAGRLGTSFALALTKHGARLVGFITRSVRSRAQAEAVLGHYACLTLQELVQSNPQLYLLTVPDQALVEVSGQLGRLLRATREPEKCPPFVAHTSGATSVDVLLPCAEAGAHTLVLHPLQTFADPLVGAERFAGTAVAVTSKENSPESQAARFGFALAQGLDARPFFLPDERRVLYHAAATLASNYFVTIEYHAEQLFKQVGLPEEEVLSLFLPLVRSTLENVSARGAVQALTGPLSRGDVETVRTHLSTLEAEAPQTALLYKALGLATLDILGLRGEVDKETITTLAGILGQPGPLEVNHSRRE